MQYSDTSGGQGIVQDVYFEASTNSTAYPIADLTRNANVALDNATSLILFADEKWDFDSTNATDLPIGTTNILSGQNDYEFDDEFLVIKGIEIQDSSGVWRKLEHIDNLTLDEQQAMSTLTEETGTPTHYDKVGNSFILIPTPNYNRRLVEEGEAGIKAYFQRKIDYFTISDTIKEPGFAKHLHKYVPLYCSYVYACAKETGKQNELAKRIEYYEGNRLRGGNVDGAFISHYRKRQRDVQERITSEYVNAQ